ncbi:MAG: C39 family peptidase [Treponema sp.]|nr:C39 family peptidase [Treponema sp.]
MKNSLPVFFAASLCALLLTLSACRSKNEYLIKSPNYFEYQANKECAGFSAAYVLRSLGIEAKGMDIYNQIEIKNPDGTVNPTEIYKIFESRNIDGDSKYNLGLDELKKDLKKGTPVIVLVKLNPTSKYYHYLTLVGYSEDELYFAESVRAEVNVKNKKHYNRKVSNEDFIKMWEVDSTYKNIYFVIKK